MQRCPSKTLTASSGTAAVSSRSAQTRPRRSPWAWAAAAWAQEAITSAAWSPVAIASRRLSAALAVPRSGGAKPSTAAPAQASASASCPAGVVGVMSPKVCTPPAGSPCLICASACMARMSSDSGPPTTSAARA